MPEHPISSLRGLKTILEVENAYPPVQNWNPTRVGYIDICIRIDGSWIHDGGKIEREELVKLFAGVLRLDSDGYCLVTPVEKLLIKVEDSPFVVTSIEKQILTDDGQVILMKTNVDDEVCLDKAHALEIEYDDSGEPRPYIHIRSGLRARLLRHIFYELVSFGEVKDNKLFITSAGDLFDLGEID